MARNRSKWFRTFSIEILPELLARNSNTNSIVSLKNVRLITLELLNARAWNTKGVEVSWWRSETGEQRKIIGSKGKEKGGRERYKEANGQRSGEEGGSRERKLRKDKLSKKEQREEKQKGVGKRMTKSSRRVRGSGRDSDHEKKRTWIKIKERKWSKANETKRKKLGDIKRERGKKRTGNENEIKKNDKRLVTREGRRERERSLASSV